MAARSAAIPAKKPGEERSDEQSEGKERDLCEALYPRRDSLDERKTKPMADEPGAIMTYNGEVSPIQAYLARPQSQEPRPAVIVIHEIVGLTAHIKSVADRFAGEGYVAFAPNLFSRPDLAEVL